MILRSILNQFHSVVRCGLRTVGNTMSRLTKPISHSPALGTITDVVRSKPALVAENLLLCQQLIVLKRSVKRSPLTQTDRALFVLLASRLKNWREALLIVKPETVLRWHWQGFRLFWKRKSRAMSQDPKLPPETIRLIKEMTTNNWLWGAERIRGELLKVGIKVAKRTVQRYMQQTRHCNPTGKPGQRFFTTTPTISGRVTFFRSTTSSFGRCSRF